MGKFSRIGVFSQTIHHGRSHSTVRHRLQNGALGDIARLSLILIQQSEIWIRHLELAEIHPHIHSHRDGFVAQIELIFLVVAVRKPVCVFHQPARIV